jgi:hypothetical protein
MISSPIGQQLGAFYCHPCSRAHDALESCYVLNTRKAQDWTEEEVAALEMGGNKMINALFEAKFLWDCPRPDASSGMKVRSAFITEKYQERKYFSATAAKGLSNKSNKPKSIRLGMKTPSSGSGRNMLAYDDITASPTSSSNNDSFSFGGDSGYFQKESLGYDDAVPDSERNVRDQLVYGDATPDSDYQAAGSNAVQRRLTRRRASLGCKMDQLDSSVHSQKPTSGRGSALNVSNHSGQTRSSRNGDQLGYGDAAPDSDRQALGYGDAVPDSEPQEQQMRARQRRPRRRASLGGSIHTKEQLEALDHSKHAPKKPTSRRGSLGGSLHGTSDHKGRSSTSRSSGRKSDGLSQSLHNEPSHAGGGRSSRNSGTRKAPQQTSSGKGRSKRRSSVTHSSRLMGQSEITWSQ